MEGAQTFASVLGSLSFDAITSNVLAVIGACAGVVVGIIAIKKGWSFLKRTLRGA